ncbi:DUF4193 family protein [Arthrobacter ruber]|uniref:DUF4193 family protein n=1 Tax=Arthrobacter ruber TaxID=1258893 RepID=UPI0030B82F71
MDIIEGYRRFHEPGVCLEGHRPPANESLEAQRSSTTQTSISDVEDSDTAERFDLPGAILEDELLVQVATVQKDDFTCMSCFPVHH